MGSSKSPTVQTSGLSVQQVPQYVSDAQQGLQSYGQGMLSPFLSSTPNYAVAGLNADQLMGYDLTRQMAQDAFETSPPSVGQVGYSPTGVYGQTYSPVGVGAANGYNASGYNAQGYNAQGYDAQGYGPTMTAGASTYDASTVPGANTYNAATAGDAAQLDGASVQALMNPYIQGAIDPAVANLQRQHDATAANINAQSAAAGSYGGSRDAIQQSQNDRALGDQVSQLAGSMMAQGYGQAASEAQSNVAARNQGAQFNAGVLNQASQANQSAINNMGQFNASAQQQAAAAAAAARNQDQQFNAQVQNQAAAANAAAHNQAAQFGSNAYNQAAQFGSNAYNQAAQFGSQAQNQAAQFGAQAQNQNQQLDAAAANAAALYGAQAGNAAQQFNANAYNTAGYQNANLALQRAQLQDALYGTNQARRQQATQQLLGNGSAEQQFLQQILGVPTSALGTLSGITPQQVPVTTQTAGTQPNNQPSILQTLLGAGATLGAAALK